MDDAIIGPDEMNVAGLDLLVPPLRLGDELIPVCLGVFSDGFRLPLEFDEVTLIVADRVEEAIDVRLRVVGHGEVEVPRSWTHHQHTVVQQVLPGRASSRVLTPLSPFDAVAGNVVAYTCSAFGESGVAAAGVAWLQSPLGEVSLSDGAFSLQTSQAAALELSCATAEMAAGDLGSSFVTIRRSLARELRVSVVQAARFHDSVALTIGHAVDDCLLMTMPSVYVRVVSNGRGDEEAYISLTTLRVFEARASTRAMGLLTIELFELPSHPLNDVRWSIVRTNSTSDYVARHFLGEWEPYQDGPDEVLNITPLAEEVGRYINALTDILLDAVIENAQVPTIERFDILESPGIAATAQWGLVAARDFETIGVQVRNGTIVLEGAFKRLGVECSRDEDCVCAGEDCQYITGVCGSDEWCELRDVP